MEPQNEEIERVCFNCNWFFPDTVKEATEFGVCLNDKEFEPFIDELLENSNYACCKELVSRKKFHGMREACDEFSDVETGEVTELPDDKEFERAVKSAAKKGQLDLETLQQLILEEQFRRIDWAQVPIDEQREKLRSPQREDQSAAIKSLGFLICQRNKAAFEELFRFARAQPPVTTIEDVHFRIDILMQLENWRPVSVLAPFLIDELNNTPSSNTTRQWISEVLKVLSRCPAGKIRKPLTKMLKEKRFSYKFKRKIKELLWELSGLPRELWSDDDFDQF